MADSKSLRMGGISVQLQPWPVPDANKVDPIDRIGVIRSFPSWNDSPGQPEIVSFHPRLHRARSDKAGALQFFWCSLSWAGAASWRDEPFRSDGMPWDRLGDGWFWASEPRSLVWKEYLSLEDEEDFGVPPGFLPGDRAWASELIRPELEHRYWVLQRSSVTSALTIKVAFHLLSTEPNEPFAYAPSFDHLEEAQRSAAERLRDHVTRREVTSG